MSEHLMRIGELAARTGLSLPTIRHYDETGLLSPSARTAGNFRLYSEADYEKLMVIRRMKPLGFSVEQMREVLGIVAALRGDVEVTEEEQARLVGGLRAFIADARDRRHRLQRNVERADEFIAVLQREEMAAGPARPQAGQPLKRAAGYPS